ncbi:MAG TPA: alpha/beta fold hydrolase [Polyangiaceae bacterium]|nr:alpha/beta fold hydrolase [Polyangiaceae bacterium]
MDALHWFDEGPREAPAVVFLHAFPLHSGMWQGAREALSSRYRCLGFDVRGLGRSAPPPLPCLLEHWVDDAFALMDERGVERAVLVGCSLGGYIALRATEREPARVSGLCLVSTQPVADPNAAKLKRAAGIRQLKADGTAPYLDAFFRGALSTTTREHRPTVLERCNELTRDQTAEGLAAALVGLATRTDTTESLGAIGVPTRVMGGSDDTIVPAAVLERMAAAIPGAELRLFAGVGHFCPLETPAEFELALAEFIDGLPRPARGQPDATR